MLSVRSLPVHWPGLPADVRSAIRDVDASDPSFLVDVAALMVERMDRDPEDACELRGIDEPDRRMCRDDSLDHRYGPHRKRARFALRSKRDRGRYRKQERWSVAR
jgi:hypothetical protein